MTQLTPNGIKFKDEDQEQTKAVCSVDGVGPDSSGNIPVNFSSINTDLTDLENRLDNIGDGASSYTLSATPNPVDEGVSVTITLDTTNVFQGEEIPYTITPNGASLTDDFVSPIASTGHFKIENDTADLGLAIKEDDLTESSPESFTLTVNAGNNPYITVNINDTSQTPVPTYSLSASPNPASENQTVTVTLSTTNVSNGTYVPYTISTSGLSLTQDFTSTVASTGNFQVYNNQATRTFPLKQDELTESSPESFTLTLNAGNNPYVTVNVTDSSQTPVDSPYGTAPAMISIITGQRYIPPHGPVGTREIIPNAHSDQAEEGTGMKFSLWFMNGLLGTGEDPPYGTTINWSVVGHNGFNTSDFTWNSTRLSDYNSSLDGTLKDPPGTYIYPFGTFYPGVSSGTAEVVPTTFGFGGPPFPSASVNLQLSVDNIPESGEYLTFTFSNIPGNGDTTQSTIYYVFDPLTFSDLYWGTFTGPIVGM